MKMITKTYEERMVYRLDYDPEHPKFQETIDQFKEDNDWMTFTSLDSVFRLLILQEMEWIRDTNKSLFKFDKHGIEVYYIEGSLTEV